MAKIDLTLSRKKDKLTGRQEIVLRFYHGKKIDQQVKTGIYILDDPCYWDGEKMVDTRRMSDEARRYHNEQRAKIESLCFEIIQEWQNTDQNVPIPKDWLKTVVDHGSFI